MSFSDQIAPHQPTAADLATRRWIYIPYDRYTDRTGPLTEQPPDQTGIVIVESTAKALRRPYHKKKLIVLISNMRHFALEQAAKGVKVLYHFSPESHGQALRKLQQTEHLPSLTVMQPAERELRLDLAQAQKEGLKLNIVPDTTWASQTEDFTSVYGAYKPGKSYVMDRFYRKMRQKTHVLMSNAKPIGGNYSYDADNRNPYKGQVPIPIPPSFPPDEITKEVIALVDEIYAHHFGISAGFDLPCTQADCDAMWRFALEQLLPTFGPFEDAMRDDQLQLFHSKTSVLLNLGRLLAMDLIHDVEAAQNEGKSRSRAPKGSSASCSAGASSCATFTSRPTATGCCAATFRTSRARSCRRFRQTRPPPPGLRIRRVHTDPYAGATPSALGAALPLPAVYWGVKSGLHCMDTVVAQVVEEGWSHHITRLMVLSNLANLCGFSPRELTDWFWFAYVDAYDWVVETNVLGMATYADGGLTATKPYVSGAAYINRMSNYCGHCRYDPKKSVGEGSCPFTSLYWTFLERNEDRLSGNFRMQMPYNTLHRKRPEELVQLRARAAEAVAHLQSFARPEY